MDFNQLFRDRIKQFSIAIIRSLSPLPYSGDLSVIRKQIIRFSTSVAAHYRAACRAQSDKEKFAKICVVAEEIDETQFWLELTEEPEDLHSEKIICLRRNVMNW